MSASGFHRPSTLAREPGLGESALGSNGFTLHENVGVYVISVAAELAGMHPQTLRTYDRLGLVSPSRSTGRGRRYSMADVRRLQEVARLSQDEGLNLEGIRRVLALTDQVEALQHRVQQLAEALTSSRAEAAKRVDDAHASHRRDLVPVDRAAGAVVVYERPRRR